MERPYRDHTRDELGAEFAAAVRLGGRPITRTGTQLSYADLALEAILEEFRCRAFDERVAELQARDVASARLEDEHQVAELSPNDAA
jgi:hypothetical protein